MSILKHDRYGWRKRGKRRSSFSAALCFALLWLTAGAVLAAAPDFPALTGRVVDEAGILSAQAESELVAQLAAHEQTTSNQIVVVTLKSLRGYEISDYGYQLGRHWGIGQKGRNNGVLLIIAPNERKVRIEVGYGLEGALTDAESRVIIERVIKPPFQQGDYEQGIRGGVNAIFAALGGEYQALPPVTTTGEENHFLGPLIGGLFILHWVFGAVARRASTRTRTLAAATFGVVAGILAWFFLGILLLAIGIAVFVFLFMLLAGGRVGRGGSGYGDWGSGGGGGGFSGGGGSFGGGGASGDW